MCRLNLLIYLPSTHTHILKLCVYSIDPITYVYALCTCVCVFVQETQQFNATRNWDTLSAIIAINCTTLARYSVGCFCLFISLQYLSISSASARSIDRAYSFLFGCIFSIIYLENTAHCALKTLSKHQPTDTSTAHVPRCLPATFCSVLRLFLYLCIALQSH